MGSRAIALASGVVSLVASFMFALVVTRRLLPQDLALLAVVNTAVAIATTVAGYASAWYPRILSREPNAYGELLAAGLILAAVGWAAGVFYILLFSPWLAAGLEILTLYLAVTLLSTTPAAAYLSVHRQRLSALLSLAAQAIKMGGVWAVRMWPTAASVLLLNALMSLPTALAVRARPRLNLKTFKTLAAGAPFQTLVLLTTLAGSTVVYAIAAAGGDTALYYNMLLFQMSKALYPALSIVPLMYGSMLTSGVERRALIDGAIYTAVLLAVSATMLNSPQVFLALLRPQEVENDALLTAVRINAIALILWGFALHHAWPTLMAEEKKTIISTRDKPSRALALELAATPAVAILHYLAVLHHGAVGLAAAGTIWGLYTLAVKLRYVEIRRALATRLYLPTALALGVTTLLPPLPHTPRVEVINAVVDAALHAAYYTAPAYLTMAVISQPFRQLAIYTIKKLLTPSEILTR
ncbi:MAG: hypothetical protein ACK4SY_09105 [Pyrobaculum sp.]